MRLWHVAGEREQQRHRVLGRSDHVRLGRVGHEDPALGGGLHIDVVDPDTRAPDCPQPLRAAEQLRVELRGRADQDRVEPADPLPYLADVARIERAWTEAYHAADAQPLTAEAFAPLTPCDAVGLRLLVHPSLRVVRSRLPAVTVWRMNVADGVPKPVDFEAGGEDGLVLPPEADVEVRVCAPGGAEFVDALAARLTLAEAAEAALRADDRFDLSANLVALIAMGAFVGAEEVNRKATSN